MGNNSKSKITPYLYLVPCMLDFWNFPVLSVCENNIFKSLQNQQDGTGKAVRWFGQL